MQLISKIQLQGTRHNNRHRRNYRDEQRALSYGNSPAFEEGLQEQADVERTQPLQSSPKQHIDGKQWFI